MDLNIMIQKIKKHPDYNMMGMVASHLGVVRKTSLKGVEVEGIEVVFDKDLVQKIIYETEQLPGIVKVLVETSDGRLEVGDDIMAVVVGGDTRDHVFPSLIKAVDRIKKEAVQKKELF